HLSEPQRRPLERDASRDEAASKRNRDASRKNGLTRVIVVGGRPQRIRVLGLLLSPLGSEGRRGKKRKKGAPLVFLRFLHLPSASLRRNGVPSFLGTPSLLPRTRACRRSPSSARAPSRAARRASSSSSP